VEDFESLSEQLARITMERDRVVFACPTTQSLLDV
jgi:hypothetical protein